MPGYGYPELLAPGSILIAEGLGKFTGGKLRLLLSAGVLSTVLTSPASALILAGQDYGNIFTAANTFRNASGLRTEQASTQDAIAIVGRAGGTSSFALTITPAAALTGNFSAQIPTLAANDTFAMRGLANTFTPDQTFAGKIFQTYTGNSAPGNQGVSVAGDHLVLFDALNHDFRMGVDSAAGSWIKSLNSSGSNFKIYTSPAGGVATLAVAIDSAQNCGFGGATPTAGNGLLQLSSGTTKANGVAHGDTFQYRSGAGVLTQSGPAATDIGTYWIRSTGETVFMFAAPGSGVLGTSTNHSLNIRTNNILAIAIDTAQGCTFSGALTLADAKNIILGSTTGSQFGTAATQKLGFWGATPIVQKIGYGIPTGNVQTASFPGATATLLQTSQELAQLLLDLKAAGIIGA